MFWTAARTESRTSRAWRHGCIDARRACKVAPQLSQLDGDILNCLIAVFGIFRQTSPHNSLQIIRSAGAEVTNWRRRLAYDFIKRIDGICTCERFVARHCFEEDATERENI